MPTKKTVYDIDLTVDRLAMPSDIKDAALQALQGPSPDAKPVPSSKAEKPSAPSSPAAAAAAADGHKPEVPSSPNGKAPAPQSNTPAAEPAAKSGQEKEKKKHKKKSKGKKKHKHDSSSSDSSSSSSSSSDSSDSDEEQVQRSKGMRRALESWRYPLYSPSASYRQLDTLAGSHHYTISGFSLARAMGCGTRLCSDLFEVAGQAFRLEVYPSGFTADTRKFMSVFLTTPGSITPNHVLFEIAVLDQSGKDKHIVATSNDAGRHLHRHGPMLTYSRGVVGAVLRLAKTKDLEEKRKRYLPHDMLVLRATVHVLRGWSSVPAIHGHLTSSLVSPQRTGYLSGTLGSLVPPPGVPTMQGLVMPGFGLGPSTLQPVPVPPTAMTSAVPMPGTLTSPWVAQAPTAYQLSPGLVQLAPYAAPMAGYQAAQASGAGPQWVGQPTPVYTTLA